MGLLHGLGEWFKRVFNGGKKLSSPKGPIVDNRAKVLDDLYKIIAQEKKSRLH